MTKGEYRVGITFNPSNDARVDTIKEHAAALIDLIESIPETEYTADMGPGERSRLKALAQTAIEEGAMWAVKAATKQPMGN